jgi:hypothetical protein
MLDKITTILNPKFKENFDSNSFDLLEDSPEAKCKIARFQYVEGGEVAVYKFDKKNEKGNMIEIFPFFENVTNLKKMCDFILFYKTPKQQLFIILCNLKSDVKGSDTAQIHATEIFINFIIQSAKRIYPTENFDFILKKVHYRSNSKAVQKKSLQRKEDNTKNDYYFYSEKNTVATCNLTKICR